LIPAIFFENKMHISEHMIKAVLCFALTLCSQAVSAQERILQHPESFIVEQFPQNSKPSLLWLSQAERAEVTRILGHAPNQLRQRYWRDGSRTLWILEEIGKEDLITAGLVVNQGRIEKAKVLVYRESRGMEISSPAFLEQFLGVALTDERSLNRNIDGISGATLSVQAMERMTRAALYFDQLIRSQTATKEQAK
jgi:hypothetical protein